MPKRRIESKLKRRDDVLSHPGGWLVFLLGWSYNGPTSNRPEPFFESIEDMRQYYFDNRERVLAEMGNTTDFWAWHQFEPHDRQVCEYCRQHNIEAELRKLGNGNY
jgi:hypothetical protein